MWNRAADKIVFFSAGFFLDLIFGDPYWMPHPVRLMGRLINGTERVLRGGGEGKGRGDGGQIRLGGRHGVGGFEGCLQYPQICGDGGGNTFDLPDFCGQVSEG